MAQTRRRRSAAKKAPSKKKPKANGKTKAPTAKDYLRDLKKMKDKGEPDWGMLSEDIFATAVKERVPTGSLAVDQLIGGGWPVGRIVEVASWEGVGKSTLLDQSMAEVQRMGGVAALIDSEQCRDEKYTERLGVNVDELLVHPAGTIEECFAGIDKLLDLQEKVKADHKGEPPVMFIVWDSIGGTPTNEEKEGDADDRHVGSAARIIRQDLRRICARVANLRVVIVCANHFYRTIGPFATLKTYGGGGILYFTSLRVWLTNKGKLKVGDKAVGHVVEAKVKKTKIGKPRPPVEAGLIWGSGIDNSYTLFEWGKKHGVNASHRWVTRHGSWFFLMRPDGTHENFQHGFAGFGAALQEHPDIYKQMAEQYLNG
jgi:recombination protein RecA